MGFLPHRLSQPSSGLPSWSKGLVLLGLLIFLEGNFHLLDGLLAQVSQLEIPTLLKRYARHALWIPFIALPLVCLEWALPGYRDRKDYLKGAMFWLICGLFTTVAVLLSRGLIEWFEVQPLVKIQPDLTTWPRAWRLLAQGGLILLSMFIFDFFYYWFHRFQHTWPWLWRFHAVHHSIENLNSLESYHHVSEDFLRIPFIALPLAWLVDIQVTSLLLLSAFTRAWGIFIHANTAFNLGRFQLLIGDNQMHRLHHSIHPDHYDRNFAAFFPVWDWLFGTLAMPQGDEFPAVGLTHRAEPRSFWEYFTFPFTGKF